MRVYLKENGIQKILIRRNKTRAWLAEKVGTTTQYLSEVITTRKSPSANMREKIMQALRPAKWDDLFTLGKFEGDDEK